MAQRIKVELVDDLDGSVATTTVRFAYRGKAYDIDLSDSNLESFDRVMDRYIRVARTAGRSGSTSRKATAAPESPAAAVRAWAKNNGVEVRETGAIPAAVREQYEQAQAS